MTTTPTPAPPAVPWRTRLKKHALRLWERLSSWRRGLSWSAVILGGLVAAVALWPLAAAVWDLLGLTSGQTWRMAVAGVGAVLLAAGVVGINWKPDSKRTSPVRLVWLILAAWTVAAGAVAAMTALAWLVLDTPRWQPPQELTPKNLDAIATRAFAIVAGLGGVALLVISYRRQRTTEADAVRAEAANARAELAAEREVAKLFTETFDSASDKLGSEHAAVRLAGVHALARLADEAPEGREDLVQMVIDVLCAYLRMPYTPRPEAPSEHSTPPVLPSVSSTTAVDLSPLGGSDHDDAHHEKHQAAQEEHRERVLDFESFQQVRHTIIRVIGDRLRRPTRWRGKDYDFTGVVFDGGDLSRAHFTGGLVDFSRSRFIDGRVTFVGAEFIDGKVTFVGAEFTNGIVDFVGARFTGGRVDFDDAKFTSGKVNFSMAKFTKGTVDFSEAEFTGGKVDFGVAEFTGGWVNCSGARFTGEEMQFLGARFTGGAVSFSRAEFTGGWVNFFAARFIEGRVSFFGTRFTDVWVEFSGATFLDGTVDFDEAEFIGGEVGFRNATGKRPQGLPSHLWQPAEDEGSESGAS